MEAIKIQQAGLIRLIDAMAFDADFAIRNAMDIAYPIVLNEDGITESRDN